MEPLFIKDTCNWKSQSTAHCHFLTPYVSNKTRQLAVCFQSATEHLRSGLSQGTRSDTHRHQARGKSNNPPEIHYQVCYYQKRNFHWDAFFGIMRPTKYKALLLVIQRVFHINFLIWINASYVPKESWLYQKLYGMNKISASDYYILCTIVFNLKNTVSALIKIKNKKMSVIYLLYITKLMWLI